MKLSIFKSQSPDKEKSPNLNSINFSQKLEGDVKNYLFYI